MLIKYVIIKTMLTERKKAYNLEYYAKHRAKLMADMKRRYHSIPVDKRKEMLRKRYWENRAVLQERSRQSRQRCAKRIREYRRKYRKAHPDLLRKKQREWQLAHYDQVLRERREKHRQNNLAAKQKVYAKLGRVCKQCGIDDIRVLCIDHVNGDGKDDRWYGKMPYAKFLDKVVADKTGRYQILCQNCNWIKRWENKEYGYKNRGSQKYDIDEHGRATLKKAA
jgi:hypothetical protein